MSRILSFKRDLMTILGLIMLGIGMLCVGMLAATSIKQIQLMYDGESETARWARDLARLLEAEPGDPVRMFRDNRFYLTRRGMPSRVFAFEVYDSAGRLFYSSGPSHWHPETSSQSLLNSPVTRRRRLDGNPAAQLHAVAGAAVAPNYASMVMPFHAAGKYLGSIVAFVDQTEQAGYLTYSFRIIAGVTGVMLLLAFGLFLYIVIRKTRDHFRAEERVRYLSGHDDLTGLPNRRTFIDQLSRTLETRREKGDHVAVAIIDIDRFKEINDALGHGAGDSVLRHITQLLNSNIRVGDIAARIGSDQFALTLASIRRPQQAAVFVATLSEALSAPFWINGEQISCAVSIGAAVAPGDGDEAAVLMRHANLALGRTKADGGNTFKFFEKEMNVAFVRRRDCEADLRRAIDANQFELHYQPIVELGRNAICAYEALIRWNHPRDGVVSPAVFIPLAEETEMIIPIGEWVLRRACQDAVSWTKPLKVSVNLSPVQFVRCDMVELVGRVLEETGLEPSRLELEITESLLISSTSKVAQELEGLHKLGVSIAMDDFGTGYSSLSYISSFAFDKIKIDKAFVQSMIRDKAILGIVKCIVAMGNSLGVTITAEGVETTEQREILKDLGCDQLQGFLYGMPVSAAECAQRISRPLRTEPAGQTAKSRAGRARAAV